MSGVAISTRDRERVVVIEAGRRSRRLGLLDIWRYRELVAFLAWRDVTIRYKHTALGALWALIQPLAMTAIFVILFGRLAGLQQLRPAEPYVLVVLTGLLPWTFFAATVAAGSSSLLGNASLITKVFFPRVIIPVAAMGAPFVDLCVSVTALAGLLIFHRIHLGPRAALSLVAVAIMFVAAIGFATLLGALIVRYRDLKYVVPFGLQLGMYVTPVIYPLDIIPAEWHPLLAVNPMVGVVHAMRSGLLSERLDLTILIISSVSAVGVALVGFAYFRSIEGKLADFV